MARALVEEKSSHFSPAVDAENVLEILWNSKRRQRKFVSLGGERKFAVLQGGGISKLFINYKNVAFKSLRNSCFKI